MDQTFNEIYREMILLKEDLEAHLERNELSPFVKEMAEAELHDLIITIEKVELGHYGICEKTGDELPLDHLKAIPTISSLDEIAQINHYYKIGVCPQQFKIFNRIH